MMRVAIVGGETHIEEITNLDGQKLEIVGVSVRDKQKNWAKELFTTAIYTDYQKLFEEKKPDIVALANENDLKAKVIIEALERGCHVIADKPMAIRLSEVKRIEDLVQKNELRFLMLLTLRGNAQYRKVKEIVEGGEIGVPVQCYAKMSVKLKKEERPPWFLDKNRSGGPILDLAIHSLDVIEWIIGLKFIEVTAYESNLSHPEMLNLIDSGAEFFKMENGGTALVEQNRFLPDGWDSWSDYRLNIVGTKGQVNLRFGKSVWIQTQRNKIKEFKSSELTDNVSVVADWLESLENTSYEPIVPDAASIRANKVACLAQEAADTGKKLII